MNKNNPPKSSVYNGLVKTVARSLGMNVKRCVKLKTGTLSGSRLISEPFELGNRSR